MIGLPVLVIATSCNNLLCVRPVAIVVLRMKGFGRRFNEGAAVRRHRGETDMVSGLSDEDAGRPRTS